MERKIEMKSTKLVKNASYTQVVILFINIIYQQATGKTRTITFG